MKWRYFLPLVAVLGLLVLLAYGFTRDPREIKSPLIGKRAAPFTLTLFDGGRFELEAQKLTTTTLSRWASRSKRPPSKRVNVKAGARLPISGDLISRGSRVNP